MLVRVKQAVWFYKVFIINGGEGSLYSTGGNYKNE